MTENDMNEQPTGQQPAEGAASPSVPAVGDISGWRPPSEPTAAPAAEPTVPTTQIPQAPSTGEQPVGPTYPAAPQPEYPTYSGTPYAPPAASPYAPPPGYQPGSAYQLGAAETPTANYPTAGTATSSYPVTGTHEPKRRGVGFATVALLGALGLVLAGGGGVAGAAIMHHYDSNDKTVVVTSTGKVVSNAPIIDRSSLASIAAGVSTSVVSIDTGDATGSGVILSADGDILTNNHVAATANGKTVQITFSDGSNAQATLVGTDPKTDLAVYKAQNVSGLHAATFGNSDALQVGDTVLAIGSPLGLDGTVTAGIVSALNRTINESSDSSPSDPSDPFGQGQSQSTTQGPTIAGAIQTDASINPGNSGGALVNTSGEVVGINTAIATNGGAEGSIGVGFSIPSNRAQQVAKDIINGTAVSHPQLGINVGQAPNNAGALVSTVNPGTAADKAGMKANDVITQFNGKTVHTTDDLLNAIQSSTVGTPYPVVVDRGGSNVTLSVTLQEAK